MKIDYARVSIAATALTYRMAVVTRNAADFAGTGVAVINPWEIG